jgi:uncharacterized phage protein (TIGR02218 family)
VKTIPAGLQTHYASGDTKIAFGLVIERPDGQMFGFTTHDKDLTLDVGTGPSNYVELDARQGLDFSGVVSTSGMSVDNMEITTLDDGSLFVRDDLLAGRWKNSRFRIFRHRWDVDPVSLANDTETLMRGWLGESTLNLNTIKIELRGLKQLLQQPVGIVSSKTCRARLGDSACTVNLAPFTASGEVTSVTDRRTFAANLAPASDYYGDGLITWTSGANIGLSQKVRGFASSVFDLQLQAPFDIEVGDTFTAIAGCRKRLEEDCRDKFDNVLNFQGEPHRPTSDDLVTTTRSS